MSIRRHLALWTAVLLLACERTNRVASGRIELTRIPVRVRFERPVPAEGPTRELCLVGSEGNVAAAVPGGAEAVQAVLLTSAGARDTMDTRNVERRSNEMICYWDHGLAGPQPDAGVMYTGVELSATNHVRAREVRWWSGHRKKWLF